MRHAAIESAALARIKAASDQGVLGYALRQVESYAGQLDDEMPSVIRAMPAVWGCFVNAAQRNGTWMAQFLFLCGARSARNDRLARHGAEGEVGAYQIAQDVAALLDGRTCGVDGITSIHVDAIRLIANGKLANQNLAVLAVEFQATWTQGGDAPAYIDGTTLVGDPPAEQPVFTDSIDDFTHFHSDWDVPLFLDPAPATLPLSDGADAVDDVSLAGSEGE